MRAALVVSGALIVGAVGVVFALDSRGGDGSLRSVQSAALTRAPPRPLSTPRVDAELMKSPEPVPAARRTAAVRTRCESKGAGALRNPWACTVSYRSGLQAHYLVQVRADGSYSGVGTAYINGCCVKLPTLE
jgi:hypothetical protein